MAVASVFQSSLSTKRRRLCITHGKGVRRTIDTYSSSRSVSSSSLWLQEKTRGSYDMLVAF